MKDKITDQQFIDAVKNNFEQSIEQLDASATSRLSRIRHVALKGAEPFSVPAFRLFLFKKRVLTPLIIVTACLAVMIFTLIQPATSTSSFKAEDIEILSTSEELDIYEDLEFYQWLEEYEISA